MAIFINGRNSSFSRFRIKTLLQRLNQTTEGRFRAKLNPKLNSILATHQDKSFIVGLNHELVSTSKRRKVDANTFGIPRSLVPHFSWTVLETLRGNGFESYLVGGSRLNSSLLQMLNHTTEGRPKGRLYPSTEFDTLALKDNNTRLTLNGELVDVSKWRKVDARKFGITGANIPHSAWTVLKVLRGNGFEAYLVGGCVRDLLLHKVPKDFDVITTANLKEIQTHFHRNNVVGERFPICRVYIKGFVIEVSSFDTVAQNSEAKEEFLKSQMPSGCDEKDFNLWRNSMHRDFTINSLFFDPFLHKIYDYADGMADLRSLKLRTILPPCSSFQEDCARILRGLRIAARLGLSFSKDTEAAICNLSSSVESLGKFRIMLELKNMLSYGAAEPSISLLRRFNILGMFLPFQAAYLGQEANEKTAESSMMLMKLLSNMDKLVSCDQPADCRLWVGLLAFHQALVKHPQDALVIWAFASVMYHGNWMEAIKFARENANLQVNFVPEIFKSSEFTSDEELAKKVNWLAYLLQQSVYAMAESDGLIESMSRYPAFPCSGTAFIPRKVGEDVHHIFNMVINDLESYGNGKENLMINYYLLGKGNPCETRFVLGKIILETMRGGLLANENTQQLEFPKESSHLRLSNMVRHHIDTKKTPNIPLALKNQDVVLKEEYSIGAENPEVVDMCQLSGQDLNVTCLDLKQVITMEKPEATDDIEVEHVKNKPEAPRVLKIHELILKEETNIVDENQESSDMTELFRELNIILGDKVEKKKHQETTVKTKEAVGNDKVKHMKVVDKVKQRSLLRKVSKKQISDVDRSSSCPNETIKEERKSLEKENQVKENAVENDRVKHSKVDEDDKVKHRKLQRKVTKKQTRVTDNCNSSPNVMTKPEKFLEEENRVVLPHEAVKENTVENEKVKYRKVVDKMKGSSILVHKVTKKQIRVSDKSNSSLGELIKLENCAEKESCGGPSYEVVKEKVTKKEKVKNKAKHSNLQPKVTKKHIEASDKHESNPNEIRKHEKFAEIDSASPEVVKENTEKQKHESVKEKGTPKLLSSLFS